MELNYTEVTDPKWADEAHTTLELQVTFDEWGTVPFSCKADDDTEHGMHIFTEAAAGVYGDIAEYVAPEAPPVPVPQSVTRFQGLAALTQEGLLASVEEYMALESTDWLSKLAWKEALTFDRDSTMVASMATLLGLTDAQLDELFIQASKIK